MTHPENLDTSSLPVDPYDPAYLRPTSFLDFDHPTVRAFADRHGLGATDRERAVSLFYAVRDEIRYSPYGFVAHPDALRASSVLQRGEHFCVPKAILLSACCRARGIPARLGFADVTNHLTTEKLRRRMGTDVFVFHGYSEIWLEGRWVKATPTFNKSLCDKFGVLSLEWDGRSDSLLQPYDRAGNKHMEYVRDRGSFADLPLAQMLEAFAQTYGHLDADSFASQGDFAAEAATDRGG